MVFVETANIANIRFVILANNSKEITLNLVVDKQSTLCDFLAAHCELSKIKIKDALIKGAAHLKRSHSKKRRVRKAKFQLSPGDIIQFCYSEKILNSTPLQPSLLHKESHYSIWHKPSGMLTQGTQFGDHCSLLRHIEQFFKNRYDIKVVHRLDKDASGIILFAHNRFAAKKFSELFSHHSITKIYMVKVHGIIGERGDIFLLSEPVDGKKASTEVKVVKIDNANACSHLEINLLTGRKHQIRRHLSDYGYPIVGDVLYGDQSKKKKHPLQLTAFSLHFRCPFRKQMVDYHI